MSFPPLPELTIALGVFAMLGVYVYILHRYVSKELEKHHSHSILAPSASKGSARSSQYEEEFSQAA
jgi:hypothetical protein